MDRFLKPTAVIDCDSARVVSLAAEIVEGAADDEDMARRCFLWVRDCVRHSSDHGIQAVTCTASEVIEHRAGLCYAKSHLLAALLRARGIPVALCYQRLSLDDRGTAFCLHGMVSTFLQRYGWYRVDPRGNKAGIATDFCPPVESLAFAARGPGEEDIPERLSDALPNVVSALRRYSTTDELCLNLPDYARTP